MARRKKTHAAPSPVSVEPEAPAFEPPPISEIIADYSPVIDAEEEGPDVAFDSVPDADAEAVAIVDEPTEPVPAEPPAATYRDRKLAQLMKDEAAARDAGNDGLANHYRNRYTQIKGA